jgi:uncharacterized membrane protein YkvA (DUF1232 family)
MAMRLGPWLFRPSLLRALIGQVRLAWRLVREPAVPLLVKAVPVFAGLYVLSPIDIVPDVLPILGQLDDLTLLLVALEGFLKLCPAHVVDFHRAARDQGRRYAAMPHEGEIIDVAFRHEATEATEETETTDSHRGTEKRRKLV